MEEITDLYGQVDQELMYQAAIRQPLESKVEQAIALIRTYEGQALQLSPEGYYVCFSGGKDSIVMAKLFELAGVKYLLHYNNVTIDPPELVQFIKKEYPQAEWHSVGRNLPSMMADRSIATPPTRLARWCCEIYKEQGGVGSFRSIGVRAEESARRKGLWTSVKLDRTTRTPILCPILYWTDSDVWAFITQREMKYCCLYDEGFSRLGCVGCPMAPTKQRIAAFKRWPKHEQMWRRGFQKLWDTYKGVPTQRGKDRAIEQFQTVDSLWDWWMGKSVADGEQADCQMWLW